MSEFTLPPPPVPGFGPAEPILEQFNMTPFAKMAQVGARQAAGTIASDLQPALDVANDPRNAWIGTNPVGRAGLESFGLLVGALNKLRGQASRIAIRPGELDPGRFMTVREGAGKPYERLGFPQDFTLQVTHAQSRTPEELAALQQWAAQSGLDPAIFDSTFLDGMKGLNAGHALRRAADNWPDAQEIRIVGKERP